MEPTNGIHFGEPKKLQLTPREFVIRYAKYIPWLLLSASVALVLAKIKLRYAIPIYRAESRLLIKRESPYGRSNDKFDDIFMGTPNQNVYNEIQLLKSRPLAARVVKKLHLQNTCFNKGKIRSSLLYREAPIALVPNDPDSVTNLGVQITVVDNDHFVLNEETKKHSFYENISSGAYSYKVVKLFPQVYNISASNTYTIGYIPMPSAVESVVGGLVISLSDNLSQIINLSYESENPFLAKDILNTLMAVYKESNIEDKRETRISTLDFIDERLDSIRIELGLVEREVSQYMTQNKAFQLDKQSEIYLQKLNSETTNLVQQDLRLSIINYLIRYLQGNSFKAVPIELGTQEPALEPLITSYNQLQVERQNALHTMPETNPYIQQNLDPRLNKLRSDILEALKTVQQSYEIARSSIQKQNSELEGRLQSIPSKGRELAERQRQQKIKEELYLFLLQKREESAIASASTISDSRVVEPALAGAHPIRPSRRSTYMLALVLGLALPAGIVMLKEYLNDRVNSRQDIERETDAPFIGEIGHSENAGALVVTQNSRRFISEQFRIIRTNLQFILNKSKNPVILVTSSFSGEGKSFVSTNMGAVMALTGKKTVIVELDIRKPKIISNLELKRQSGVTNYIVGKVQLEDIIMPVPNIENLYVVPCGPVPPNPAEMLLDPKLKEMFSGLKEIFDIIIVDTAPVGLVSDAMVIGAQADCTLYILRQGYTYKKQLGLINEMYTQSKLPRLSLLLNDVKTGVGYGSYYGYSGYGYGYGYGYGAGYFDDDGKRKKKSVLKKLKRAIKI